MNKRVITLLTGSLQATNDGNDIESLKLAAEAVAELGLIVYEEAQVTAVKAVKAVKATTTPTRRSRARKAPRQNPRRGQPKLRVSPETKALIWARFQAGEKPSSLARSFGLGGSTVGHILLKQKKALGLPIGRPVGTRKAPVTA
jgi:hypothetical protein